MAQLVESFVFRFRRLGMRMSKSLKQVKSSIASHSATSVICGPRSGLYKNGCPVSQGGSLKNPYFSSSGDERRARFFMLTSPYECKILEKDINNIQ